MFTTYAANAPQSSTEPVEVYLACDPTISGANETLPLLQYVATGDRTKITIPPEASPILLQPLTAKQIQACRTAAATSAPDSYLGTVLKARWEASEEAKDARLAEPTSPGAFGRAFEGYILSLSDVERAAFEAHGRYTAEFGREFAFASIVPHGFPFRLPNGEPYKAKNALDLRNRIESIRPLSQSNKVIDEILLHATRLTFLGDVGKG